MFSTTNSRTFVESTEVGGWREIAVSPGEKLFKFNLYDIKLIKKANSETFGIFHTFHLLLALFSPLDSVVVENFLAKRGENSDFFS